MVEHLPDAAKIEMAKHLQQVEAQSRQVRKCLLVQLSGIGRFDAHATRAAWEQYESTIEAAAEIASETVKPAGLFVDSDRLRATVELGDER